MHLYLLGNNRYTEQVRKKIQLSIANTVIAKEDTYYSLRLLFIHIIYAYDKTFGKQVQLNTIKKKKRLRRSQERLRKTVCTSLFLVDYNTEEILVTAWYMLYEGRKHTTHLYKRDRVHMHGKLSFQKRGICISIDQTISTFILCVYTESSVASVYKAKKIATCCYRMRLLIFAMYVLYTKSIYAPAALCFSF